MNARMKFVMLAFSLFFAAAQTGSAQQKFGHLNSGNLLQLMPEVKVANDSLKLFGDAMGAKQEAMAKNFQAAVESYQKDHDAGTLTQLQMQAREADLQKMQSEGQEFEKSVQNIVNVRRQQLLDPILNKVDEAIKAVGKEGGFAMIFDTSTGAALFASDSEDVMELVKKKLGL